MVDRYAALDLGDERALFHGTTVDNAAKIAAEGFKPSESGVLGPGVYATDDPLTASGYGRERSYRGDEYAIIGCRVRLRQTVDVISGGNVCVKDTLQVLPVCIFYLERFPDFRRRKHTLVRP